MLKYNRYKNNDIAIAIGKLIKLLVNKSEINKSILIIGSIDIGK